MNKKNNQAFVAWTTFDTLPGNIIPVKEKDLIKDITEHINDSLWHVLIETFKMNAELFKAEIGKSYSIRISASLKETRRK